MINCAERQLCRYPISGYRLPPSLCYKRLSNDRMIWTTRIHYRTIFSLGGPDFAALTPRPVHPPRGGGFDAAAFPCLIPGHYFNFFRSAHGVFSADKGQMSQVEAEVQPPMQVNDPCAECHIRITPGIVVDWQLSKHSANDVGCAKCHGDRHNSMTDAANAGIAGPEVCAETSFPPGRAVRQGQARQCLGRNESHAYSSLAANGPGGRAQGLRGLPSRWPQNRRGGERFDGERIGLRDEFVRRLPYEAPFLGR